jgi:hypothetical protein
VSDTTGISVSVHVRTDSTIETAWLEGVNQASLRIGNASIFLPDVATVDRLMVAVILARGMLIDQEAKLNG